MSRASPTSSPRPGLINLDFADVKSVMQGAGSALMGIGSARGEDRAVAGRRAGRSPARCSRRRIDGAHGVLLSIQGGSDLGLFEINEAARLVQEAAHPEANIIFGAVIDDALGDEVRVTVIAAGFDGGGPSQRHDDRALGQVMGRRSRPAAPAAGAAAAARGGSAGAPAAAQRRPAPAGRARSPRPAGPAAAAAAALRAAARPAAAAPGERRRAATPRRARLPQAGPAAAAASRTTFDASDDLDVPDFLK